MTIRVMFPAGRWREDLHIEVDSVGKDVEPVFCDGLDKVTDEQWRSCDGLVSSPDPVAAEKMHLLVFYDPYRSNGSDLALGIRRADSLEELMAQCDIVSVHVPLGDETRKLIGVSALAAAKPGVVLVNTARGDVVDLDALYDALRDNRVLAAGLDVLPEEPANPQARLIAAWTANEPWIKDRLLLTPHSAFFTPQSVYDMRFKGGWVAARYLREGRLENCVNEAFLRHRR